jgi:hypothetical protein
MGGVFFFFFFLFRKIKFFRGVSRKDVGRHETMLRDTKMFARDFFSGI